MPQPGCYPVWNSPLHCVNICRCDWFKKESEWPIDGQDKVRSIDKQNTGKKKGRIRGVARKKQRKLDMWEMR